MAQLPDISDEDKNIIAGIEAELKANYDEEAQVLADLKAKRKVLNERHREAVRIAHKNRSDVINADPQLKELQATLSQTVGLDSGGNE